MRGFYRFLCAFFAIVGIGCACIQLLVIPRGTATISRQYDYATEDDARAAVLPDKIEEDGNVYVLDTDNVNFEPTPEVPMYEKTFTFDELTEKVLPPTQTVTIDGKSCKLKLEEADFKATKTDYDAAGEVEYIAYASKPDDVPDTHEIICEDGDKKIAVEGTLVSVDQIADWYWKDFTVKGRVTLPAEGDAFDYNGKSIAYSEASPEYDGFQADVLQALGLTSATTRIVSASWAGAAVADSAGGFTRDIAYAGQTKVADWTAVYEGVGSRDTYSATAIYRETIDALGLNADQSNYTGPRITAIAHYTLSTVANAGAAVGAFARNKWILPACAAVFVFLAGLCGFAGFKRDAAEVAAENAVEETPIRLVDLGDQNSLNPPDLSEFPHDAKL